MALEWLKIGENLGIIGQNMLSNQKNWFTFALYKMYGKIRTLNKKYL